MALKLNVRLWARKKAEKKLAKNAKIEKYTKGQYIKTLFEC